MKKIRYRLVTALLGLTVIFGLCALSYPTVSNWWNEKHATQAIASYVEQVQKIDDSKKEELLVAARAYNAKLSPGVDFELTNEEMEVYRSILDVSGTGIMGYVEIPSIDVYLPIYHGTEENVLQVAAGHLSGSSFPVGGRGTHAVISGHRGLPTANLFTHLDRVKEGDIFRITVLDQVLSYEVDKIRIVYPDDTAELAIDPFNDYVTLVTCTPYGVNTHRMLVRGHRIDTKEESQALALASEASRISPKVVMCGIGIPIIILVMVITYVVSGLKGKKKSQEKILKEMENSTESHKN